MARTFSDSDAAITKLGEFKEIAYAAACRHFSCSSFLAESALSPCIKKARPCR
jgi:hypothetical protein